MINYYLLTKPGIVFGNLVTLAAGFTLGLKGFFDPLLFLATFLGLAMIMAAACVFNNYIDQEIDAKMKRTQVRALVQGKITSKRALIFGSCLGIAGSAVLTFLTNPLAASLAAFGFFIYVVPYSLWKGRTVYGTAIGSIAGAIPPVVGYVAASDQLDLGALILFALMVFWQMPHFFAIALFRMEDYKKALIPVLPLVKGVYRTKVHMALYIVAFTLTAMMLTFFHYTGWFFLAATALFGIFWLILSLRGFYTQDHQAFGRQMFIYSLVVIGVLSFLIPMDVYRS